MKLRICLAPAGFVFIFLLVTFAYFDQGGGSNQNATLGEIREFVEHGSVDISGWISVTGDVSMAHGHIYSNKSPSVFFLSVPVYAVFVGVAKIAGVDLKSAAYQFTANIFLTILVASLWGALLGPLLMKVFRRLRPEWSEWTYVKLGLLIPAATLVFPYATVAFVHVFETFWAVMTFYCWLLWVDEPNDRKVAWSFGLALGMLVLANPINVALVPFVLGYAAWRLVGVKRAIQVGMICGVPLIPLLIYNFILFGSVFKTNRHFLPSYFSDPRLFLGVYAAPKLSRLLNIFGFGHRSIFPGHLMLWLGFLSGNRRKIRQLGIDKWIMPMSIVGLELMHLLCFNGWHGGWAFGPRYFLPGLIMLVIASQNDAEAQRWKTTLALGFGYFIHLIVTSLDMMPSEEVMSPWATNIIPKIISGPQREYSVASFPLNSLDPAKFNLGHLMGLHGWNSLLPLLVIQAVLLVLLTNGRTPASPK